MKLFEVNRERKILYNKKAKKVEFTSFDIIIYLADRPERFELNK